MNRMSAVSIHEVIEMDGKFYVLNDVKEYEEVSLNDILITKKKSQAGVTLNTGEIKIVNIDELYS